MTSLSRLILVGLALGLGLAGCSTWDAFTYTSSRYGGSGAVNVTLRCRDTYQVYDRPDAGTLLVMTSPLNEALVNCIDGGPILAERQRQVARLYLDEKTNRPLCRLLSDREVSLVHREFSYQCPADALGPRLAQPN